MKKKTVSIIVALLLGTVLLSACGHEHVWNEATCTTPKTCSECGETEGEALGHVWEEATCTTPQICSVCGETEGTALGHIWIEATYEEPKTCIVCNETEGEPLEMTLEYYFSVVSPESMNVINEQVNSLRETSSDVFSNIEVYFEENNICYVYTLSENSSIPDEAISQMTESLEESGRTAKELFEQQFDIPVEEIVQTFKKYDGSVIFSAVS